MESLPKSRLADAVILMRFEWESIGLIRQATANSGHIEHLSGVMAGARPSASCSLKRRKSDVDARDDGSPPRDAAGCLCAGVMERGDFDLTGHLSHRTRPTRVGALLPAA